MFSILQHSTFCLSCTVSFFTLSRLELYVFLALQFLVYKIHFEVRGFLCSKVDAEKIPKQHAFVPGRHLVLVCILLAFPKLSNLLKITKVEFLCIVQNRVRKNILKEGDMLHFSLYALILHILLAGLSPCFLVVCHFIAVVWNMPEQYVLL